MVLTSLCANPLRTTFGCVFPRRVPSICNYGRTSKPTDSSPKTLCLAGSYLGVGVGISQIILNWLATMTGLEPVTSCVTGRRSNQLNYTAI